MRKAHIHRKVKCAHLVPEPAGRQRMNLVAGSKKVEDQPSRQPVPGHSLVMRKAHIHCKVKCAHLILEPIGR